MMIPTTYQRVIIEGLGYDPNEWWPVDWGEDHCTLKNRATNELKTITDIAGYGEGNCRNLAEDDEDPNHNYVQQVTGGGEGYREYH